MFHDHTIHLSLYSLFAPFDLQLARILGRFSVLWLDHNFLLETGASSNKQKLECVSSYHLFGNIVSVSSLRLPWNFRDVLILSFRDAKVSRISQSVIRFYMLPLFCQLCRHFANCLLFNATLPTSAVSVLFTGYHRIPKFWKSWFFCGLIILGKGV